MLPKLEAGCASKAQAGKCGPHGATVHPGETWPDVLCHLCNAAGHISPTCIKDVNANAADVGTLYEALLLMDKARPPHGVLGIDGLADS